MLMGQARVQPPQRRQAWGRAARRSAGQARKLRTERPAIRNGAIQHKVWQLARRPTSRAGTQNNAASRRRATGRPRRRAVSSCSPPMGQAQPQKALPRNSADTNRPAKTRTLPEATPAVAPCKERAGEK